MDKSKFIKFCAFTAGEFEDEAIWYQTEKIARNEGKTHEEIATDIKEHLDFRNESSKQYPYETWGSPELLTRIQACDHIEID